MARSCQAAPDNVLSAARYDGPETEVPMPQTATKLAIDGGEPIRTERLPYYRGAALLGEEERQAVVAVLESRSLFRYDGPQFLGKVAAFERKLASLTGARHCVPLAN